jgi:hypothetical protein
MNTYAVSSGNTGVFWLARNKSCVRFSERNTSEWTDVGFSVAVYENTKKLWWKLG